MKRTFLLTVGLLCALTQAFSQRKMERLGRGVVAVRASSSTNLVTWRLLGTEPQDIGFNVYRSTNGAAAVKLNSSVLLAGTNFEDQGADSTLSHTYLVKTVYNGVEGGSGAGYTLPAFTPVQPFYKIPIRNVPNYQVRYIFSGDLDGDGEFDYILDKWPISGSTPDLVEAYKSDGTLLWTVNCGPNSTNRNNISPGSSSLNCGHGDNITVYDINSDGKSEVIIRTANGVVFPNGSVLTDANNSRQFISVLNGVTGNELSRTPFENPYLAIGPMNGHMGIAYLDGIHPSVVWESANRNPSGEFNEIVTTWNWNGSTLEKNWMFDLAGKGLPSAHQIKIFDLDGDGKDEIVPMGYALDDDGTLLYNLRDEAIDHGDRFAITDLDPSRPGLEIYGVQQGYSPLGFMWYYCDAKTGKLLLSQSDPGNPDVGRGMAGDFDPRYKGYELYTFVEGLYNVSGQVTSVGVPASYPNLRFWWDGDLGSENLDNRKFTKWNYQNNQEVRLYTANASQITQNGRTTPALYGDLIGDWREEAVYESLDRNSLYVYTTPHFTTHRIYTLPHNPGYRNDMTVRGYYQSHNPDYYLGYDMPQPPIPPIQQANKHWVGQTAVWDQSTANWNDGQTAQASANADTLMFDIRGNATQPIQLNTVLAPGRIWMINPEGIDYVINGTGKLTGPMDLWKSGTGNFTLGGTHDYTGKTIVSEGLLNIQGSLQSEVTIRATGAIGGRGTLLGGLVVEKGLHIKGGRIAPGFGETASQLGTLKVQGNLSLTGDNNLEFDVVPGSAGVNDSLVVTGNLTLNGSNRLIVHFATDEPVAGTYTLISCQGVLTASPENFVLVGVDGVSKQIVIENNTIQVKINPSRSPEPIVWKGSTSNVWDFDTQNFALQNSQTAFVSKDAIRFDSTATQFSIALNETVLPASIDFQSNTDYTVGGDGVIGGTTGLTKTLSGNLTLLSTKHTYTGKTIINGGKLTVSKLGLKNEPSSIGAAGAEAENFQLNNANLVVTDRCITNRALTLLGTSTVTIPGSSAYVLFNGDIAGSGTLVKEGDGAIFMIGAKSFSGPVLIKSGSIYLRTSPGNATGLGTSNDVTIENATLYMEDARGSAQAYWNIRVPEGKNATLFTDGRSSLRGALTGAGTLQVRIPYVRTDFRGNWSQFEGKIVVSENDFRIGSTTGYAKAAFSLTGGKIYSISGASSTVSIGELSGVAGTSLSSDLSTANWIIGAKNTDATFSGNITKTTLSKVGTGTFTVDGNNTYTGNTTVNAGRLLVNNTADKQGLGRGAVSVESGAVLGGTGFIRGAITVKAGGKLQPGSQGIGTLTDSTSITLLAGAYTEVDIDKGSSAAGITAAAATTAFDVLKVTGSIQFNGTLQITTTGELAEGDSFKLFNANAYTGDFATILPSTPGTGLLWVFTPSTGTLSVKKAESPTPVTWLTFTGQRTSDEAVELSWATASERMNQHFEVQRSADARSFESIGIVAGNGTVSTQSRYRFRDESPLAGPSYYRLKQLNKDGSFEWSKTIVVYGSDAFQIAPNPVSDWLVVRLPKTVSIQELSITDLQGKAHYTGQDHRVFIQALQPGLYIVRILTEQGQELTRRIVKQ